MGIAGSLMGKLGLPGVESLAQDQVYDKYFKDRGIKNFENFHVAFVDLCNEINTALPGKHYKVPSREVLKKSFDDWIKAEKDDNEKKKDLIALVKKHIEEHTPNETAMIVTGMVAPAAATYLKKTGENAQPLKKFRLHLIPNFVFVPTSTLVALLGVRVLRIRSAARA